MTSQPNESELTNEEPIDSDEAVLEQLAKLREQPAQEGADAEDEEEPDATSLADQAAADLAAAEAEEEEVEDDPEIDLGDVKAKKSEVLAWKQGAMKDADYRQKTAEVAEAKRAAQAAQDRVETERTHYANHLDTLIGQLQTQLVGDQQALAELAATDPAEWVRQNAQYQNRFQRFQQALGERQVIEQRATEEKERKRGDWVRTNSEALHEKIPEWRDNAVKTKELSDMEVFLRQQGVGDEDMESFMNHRVYLIARKAWLADKREAARTAAKDKQVKPQPHKPLKAGAAQSETQATDAYKEAQKRARSGKEDDLMALLAAKRRNA